MKIEVECSRGAQKFFTVTLKHHSAAGILQEASSDEQSFPAGVGSVGKKKTNQKPILSPQPLSSSQHCCPLLSGCPWSTLKTLSVGIMHSPSDWGQGWYLPPSLDLPYPSPQERTIMSGGRGPVKREDAPETGSPRAGLCTWLPPRPWQVYMMRGLPPLLFSPTSRQ